MGRIFIYSNIFISTPSRASTQPAAVCTRSCGKGNGPVCNNSGVYLCICVSVSVCLCVCVSVCLCVCVSVRKFTVAHTLLHSIRHEELPRKDRRRKHARIFCVFSTNPTTVYFHVPGNKKVFIFISFEVCWCS